jgi:hypothetical protein
LFVCGASDGRDLHAEEERNAFLEVVEWGEKVEGEMFLVGEDKLVWE